jgi:hypothetical protein
MTVQWSLHFVDFVFCDLYISRLFLCIMQRRLWSVLVFWDMVLDVWAIASCRLGRIMVTSSPRVKQSKKLNPGR